MEDSSYSRRNQLKPSWVTTIQESANGPGRKKVAATFPRCRCGRDQEQCAVTKERDRDAATLAVIEQVRVSAASFLSRVPRPSACSILFTALFLSIHLTFNPIHYIHFWFPSYYITNLIYVRKSSMHLTFPLWKINLMTRNNICNFRASCNFRFCSKFSIWSSKIF
mgnify:CR=1 FL=1